jgi:hypothetical protein
MPLILGTNSIKDTGYDVANSLRFNDGSSDNLSGTLSSGSGSDVKGTISLWVKRSHLGTNQAIICGKKANTERVTIGFSSENRFEIQFQDTSNAYNWRSNALYRDISAWYSCIIKLDTANGTATSRARVWINNEEITSWNIQETVPQNLKIGFFNNTNTRLVGARGGSSTDKFFDGYIAEVVGINNALSDNTDFIEVDEDSAIIKPIDVSGLTFGTNGFYLDFENSGSLGADVSGNGNNFTVNNLTAVDQSTDTCTNNFATMNPLDQTIVGGSSATMTDGNLTWQSSSNNTSQNSMRGTFGLTQGKWYWEVKYITQSSGNNDFSIGICGSEANLNVGGSGDILEGANPNVMWLNRASNSSVRKNSSDVTTGLTDANIGDIIMLAVDMDNLKFFVGINGTWLNSANPVTGANAPSTIDANTYLPAVSNFGYSHSRTLSFNFGSPPYSISSGNSDGNGYGNFEYAVPSGYYALNTKNLAEYG